MSRTGVALSEDNDGRVVFECNNSLRWCIMSYVKMQHFIIYVWIIFSGLVLRNIGFCYPQEWSPPVRVSPDSVEAHLPKLVVDHWGRVWCAWNGPLWSGIYVSYYEGDSWIGPDTALPRDIYTMGGFDITVDTRNNIWIVTSDDWCIFLVFYDGEVWSDTIIAPGFPACNFFPRCTRDSSGNIWVAWSTDYYGWWSIFSSYYNGENWSDIIRVSYPVRADCGAMSMVTDKFGKVWIYWVGVGDTSVASLSYYLGGEWFHIFPPLGGFGGNDMVAHSDGSLWGCWIVPGFVTDTARVYARRYDATGFSDPMMIQSVIDSGVIYYPRAQMAIDSQGKVWCVWNVRVEGAFSQLFYSVWDGETWSEPQIVDSLEGAYPAIAYDPYRDRVWVAWESRRENYSAIYVSYTQATGVEENKNLNYISGSLQIAPNPFYKSIRIQYQIVKPTTISLKIYNIFGQLVKTLVNKEKVMPGQYAIVWDGRDNFEKKVGSGMYFLRLETDDGIKIRKVLYIK